MAVSFLLHFMQLPDSKRSNIIDILLGIKHKKERETGHFQVSQRENIHDIISNFSQAILSCLKTFATILGGEHYFSVIFPRYLRHQHITLKSLNSPYLFRIMLQFFSCPIKRMEIFVAQIWNKRFEYIPV